jgi:hypothetical protein
VCEGAWLSNVTKLCITRLWMVFDKAFQSNWLHRQVVGSHTTGASSIKMLTRQRSISQFNIASFAELLHLFAVQKFPAATLQYFLEICRLFTSDFQPKSFTFRERQKTSFWGIDPRSQFHKQATQLVKFYTLCRVLEIGSGELWTNQIYSKIHCKTQQATKTQNKNKLFWNIFLHNFGKKLWKWNWFPSSTKIYQMPTITL